MNNSHPDDVRSSFGAKRLNIDATAKHAALRVPKVNITVQDAPKRRQALRIATPNTRQQVHDEG